MKSAKKKAERALLKEAAALEATNKEAESGGKASAATLVTKSVAIADLLATPTAQKILGVL